MNRILKIVLLSILVVFATAPVHSIDITLTGSWTENINALDLLAGPGSNLESEHESAVDQVIVDISNTLGGGDAWRVDIRKSDISWSSDIYVHAKRTSSGTGGSTAGGTTYLQLSGIDQQFFTGTDNVTGIDIQYKISGVSVSIAPGTYTASIIYTVVDT